MRQVLAAGSGGGAGGGVLDRPTIGLPGIDLGCAQLSSMFMTTTLFKFSDVVTILVRKAAFHGRCSTAGSQDTGTISAWDSCCSKSLLAVLCSPPARRKSATKQRPRFYRVMLHNDDFNRREYVVKVLLKVLDNFTMEDAINCMQARSPARFIRSCEVLLNAS